MPSFVFVTHMARFGAAHGAASVKAASTKVVQRSCSMTRAGQSIEMLQPKREVLHSSYPFWLVMPSPCSLVLRARVLHRATWPCPVTASTMASTQDCVAPRPSRAAST